MKLGDMRLSDQVEDRRGIWDDIGFEEMLEIWVNGARTVVSPSKFWSPNRELAKETLKGAANQYLENILWYANGGTKAMHAKLIEGHATLTDKGAQLEIMNPETRTVFIVDIDSRAYIGRIYRSRIRGYHPVIKGHPPGERD